MANVADRQFDKVVSGALVRYDCSPHLFGLGAFRGVRIQAPARVLYRAGKPGRDGAFARVMVCGAYRVDAGYLGGDLATKVLLVAVDAASHEAHASPMRFRSDRARTGPPMPLVSPGQEPPIHIGYFNTNLADMLPLPEREADYHAYVALGEYASNAVHIEVRREDARSPRAARTRTERSDP